MRADKSLEGKGRRKRGETAKNEKKALGDTGYFHNCHNCGMVYFYICFHHQTGAEFMVKSYKQRNRRRLQS